LGRLRCHTGRTSRVRMLDVMLLPSFSGRQLLSGWRPLHGASYTTAVAHRTRSAVRTWLELLLSSIGHQVGGALDVASQVCLLRTMIRRVAACGRIWLEGVGQNVKQAFSLASAVSSTVTVLGSNHPGYKGGPFYPKSRTPVQGDVRQCRNSHIGARLDTTERYLCGRGVHPELGVSVDGNVGHAGGRTCHWTSYSTTTNSAGVCAQCQYCCGRWTETEANYTMRPMLFMRVRYHYTQRWPAALGVAFQQGVVGTSMPTVLPCARDATGECGSQ